MESDERLRWVEVRITSSLKPRADELKQLFTREESRQNLLLFFNNEERRHIYVFFTMSHGKMLTAAFRAAAALQHKAVFLMKVPGVAKVTRDNLEHAIISCDCSTNSIEHFEVLTREVYLPLLSTELGGGTNSDKLMDLLHRMISGLQAIGGNVRGSVTLPVPAIDVLTEAASLPHRRNAVIHILETFLISWIKQIKNALKLDPEHDITYFYGKTPEPFAEVSFWQKRLSSVISLNSQLCSPVIVNILTTLEQADSSCAQSFHIIKRDLAKSQEEVSENIKFLDTLVPWFEKLKYSGEVQDIIISFPPLLHTLLLVWQHSNYFRSQVNITRLLNMLSNLVVERAREFVGARVMDDLAKSNEGLRQCLKICAAFRGTYLDTKDKADAINQKKVDEQSEFREENTSVVWHSSVYRTARTQRGQGLFIKPKDKEAEKANEFWEDSPWPSRNHTVFLLLNNFMERCNDVLELVEVTQQFKCLQSAADGEGAGNPSLDSQVREIHETFGNVMNKFKQKVVDVLDIGKGQAFERAFFELRSSVRNLEMRLGDIIREGLRQCWDSQSRLRLLDVFEGICRRELVQAVISQTLDLFVHDITSQVKETRKLLDAGPSIQLTHQHLPPITDHVFRLISIEERIKETLASLTAAAPVCLKGERGWRMREGWLELERDIEQQKTQLFSAWQDDLDLSLVDRLKQHLLTVSDGMNDPTDTPAEGLVVVHHKHFAVNLDSELQTQLREVTYLSAAPISLEIRESILLKMRNVDGSLLQSLAARLGMVTAHYNWIVSNLREIEYPLMEDKLHRATELLTRGADTLCWRDAHARDYVEQAVHLVCGELYSTIQRIKSDREEIVAIASSWSVLDEDVFFAGSGARVMSELDREQQTAEHLMSGRIEAGGLKIHVVLASTFAAAQISQQSPAWLQYTAHVSALVDEGLKKSVLASLNALYNRMAAANITTSGSVSAILQVDMQLEGAVVMFSPPLDKSFSTKCIHEYVHSWLDQFLSRSKLVQPLSQEQDYAMIISNDDEVKSCIANINKLVDDSIEECKSFCELFKDYAFLWTQDVQFTFDEFLAGHLTTRGSANKLSRAEEVRSRASVISSKSDEYKGDNSSGFFSTAASTVTTATTMMGMEKRFLKKQTPVEEPSEPNKPSIDDFDREIEVYKNSQDELINAEAHRDVGWIQVNMQPIKKTIETYASKWMFTYTKYLSDQVLSSLKSLDAFLKRIEPGIEAITGDERDIHSFMQLMRLFNEVSTQQQELDQKFIAMKRTIILLDKYGQQLPETTQQFYTAAPTRWNNLKMKVSQAKQRLGPRIQAEAESVRKRLEDFSERCSAMQNEIERCDAFTKECLLVNAYAIIDAFTKRVEKMEAEAHDLVELQELLEQDIADFSVIKSMFKSLATLRRVWDTYKLIRDQQNEWKRHRWHKIRVRVLKKGLDSQYALIHELPENAQGWLITLGIIEMINEILACLPIMDDLGRAAMRPRHWKQLVRATGGAVDISSEGLTKMSLSQFISLGLQNHAEEVREIVKKSAKDVGIENTLKTYEEVWLSKLFTLKPHSRLKLQSSSSGAANIDKTGTMVSASECDASEYTDASKAFTSPQRPPSNSSKTADGKRKLSIGSLPTSFVTLDNPVDFNAQVQLLDNVDPILDELASHQVSLQVMSSSSSASSFQDDIQKWQKTLKQIELVVLMWLDVQDKWVLLDDVYNRNELRVALPQEAALFMTTSRDFRSIMAVVAGNANVLQICSKQNVLAKLERMNMNLETAQKAIRYQLDRRKLNFPRLFFLPQADVFNILCRGYDPGQLKPYLHKLFTNVCSLNFSPHPSSELYQLSGFNSLHDESIMFQRPVLCESVVEGWLSSFLSAMKLNSQFQLAVILDTEPNDVLKAECLPLNTPALVDESMSVKKKREKKPDKKSEDASPTMSAITEEAVAEKNKAFLFTYLLRTVLKLPDKWTFESGSDNVMTSLKIINTSMLEEKFTGFLSGEKDSLANLRQTLGGVIVGLSEFLMAQMKIRLKIESVSKELKVADSKSELDMKLEDMNMLESDGGGSVSDGMSAEAMKVHRTLADYNLKVYQVKLLTNIIIYFLNERDFVSLLEGLFELGYQASIRQPLQWTLHPKLVWEPETSTCQVRMNDMTWEYGHEFHGTCDELIVTAELERSMFWLASAVKQLEFGLISAAPGVRNSSLLRNLAHLLGQPLYEFTCSLDAQDDTLGDLLRGSVTTGAWLCLMNFHELTHFSLAFMSQAVSTIRSALLNNFSTVILNQEELPLVNTMSLFATTSDMENATVQYTSLPSKLREAFRCVTTPTPCNERVIEMGFISAGMLSAVPLVPSIVQLINSLLSLLPTYRAKSTQQSASISPVLLDALIACIKMHFMRLLSKNEENMAMANEVCGDVVPDDTELKEELDAEEITKTDMVTTVSLEKLLTDLPEEGLTAAAMSERLSTAVSGMVRGGATYAGSGTLREVEEQLQSQAVVLGLRDCFVSGLDDISRACFNNLLIEHLKDLNVDMILQGENQLKMVRSRQLRTRVDDEESVADVEVKITSLFDAVEVVLHRKGITAQHNEFSRDVRELAQLVSCNRTVAVTGHSLLMDECVSVFLESHTLLKKNTSTDFVCPLAMQPGELFGYQDDGGKWRPGVLPTILLQVQRKLECGVRKKEDTHFIVIDGPFSREQLKLFTSIITGEEILLLCNGDAVHIADNIKFIWQLEISAITSLPASLPLKRMLQGEGGWEGMLHTWMNEKENSFREHILPLFEDYVLQTLEFLSEEGHVADNDHHLSGGGVFRQIIPVSEIGMVRSMIAIFEATSTHCQLNSDYDNYVNYAALWAFGGNLVAAHRSVFADWWKRKWSNHQVVYPDLSEVWSFVVNPDTHMFVHIDDILQYSGNPGPTLKCRVVRNSTRNMAVSYLLGVLADENKPVLLVGMTGYGKSSVVERKFKNMSTDASEVSTLTISSNEFLTSGSFWTMLNECLEWKHSSCYVPHGDRRLLCIIEDTHQSHIVHGLDDDKSYQPACELLNQLIKHNGSFNPDKQRWQTVQNVAFMLTYDPLSLIPAPRMPSYISEHLVMVNLPYPNEEEQQVFFEKILVTHFINTQDRHLLSVGDVASLNSAQLKRRQDVLQFQEFLNMIVSVSIEVQEKLKEMFLATAERCHYRFTLSTLARMFQHICQIQAASTASHDSILRSWYHEMSWIYLNIFIDDVDRKRWKEALLIVARKHMDKFQIETMMQPIAVVTNLLDTSSGLAEEQSMVKTFALQTTDSTEDGGARLYQFVDDMSELRDFLQHHMEEHNNELSRVNITMYDDTVRIMFRLIQVLQAPHGNLLILSEGSPGITSSLLQLAAYICDLTVVSVNPSTVAHGESYALQHFKHDLVACFSRTGLKREQLVLSLSELELVDDACLALICELLMKGTLTHIFTEDERNSIINSIRTDVGADGSMSRELAWAAFLKKIHENLHIAINLSTIDTRFQKICTRYPSLITNLEMVRLSHWSYEELVAHAQFHLQQLNSLAVIEKENLAYLFASMFQSLRQNDKSGKMAGQYGNITNTVFVKFASRFIAVMEAKQSDMVKKEEQIKAALNTVDKGSEIAKRLDKHLTHEKMVLDQKRQGNFTLLNQIGQDKAITEEQIRLVNKQRGKIEKLERLLPQYEEAHKRSVFKAAAIVKETKNVLAELSHQGLVDLRGMQKVDSEIEDVLAAIIIIVKSPTSDLTWNRGAKRIMANLERFKEDIALFDVTELPESTLQVVHPYIKRPHFAPGYLETRTKNPAIGSLVRYVCGVVRYNYMMQSRVRPLQIKVVHTTSSLDEAKERLLGMDGKLQDLRSRLVSLSLKYENASVEKTRQKDMTEEQQDMLCKAAKFEETLSFGKSNWEKNVEIVQKNASQLSGGIALGVGLVTYLTPYDHNFRKSMLLEHWIRCLDDRGIALTFGELSSFSEALFDENNNRMESISNKNEVEESSKEAGGDTTNRNTDNQEATENIDIDKSSETAHIENVKTDEKPKDERDANLQMEKHGDNSINNDYDEHTNEADNPVQSVKNVFLQDFDAFIVALVKLLIGEELSRKWLSLNLTTRELENLAIIYMSLEGALILIDPSNHGKPLINYAIDMHNAIELDMSRYDHMFLGTVEKAITVGNVLIVTNIDNNIDTLFLSLIQDALTVNKHICRDIGTIKFNGRRLQIHPNFRLILISRLPKPDFSVDYASACNLVNLVPTVDVVSAEINSITFSQLLPHVKLQRQKYLFSIFMHLKAINDLDSYTMLLTTEKRGQDIWKETDHVCELVERREKLVSALDSTITSMSALSHTLDKNKSFTYASHQLFCIIKVASLLKRRYMMSSREFVSMYVQCLEVLSPPDSHWKEDFVYNVDNQEDGENHDNSDQSNEQDNLMHELVELKINEAVDEADEEDDSVTLLKSKEKVFVQEYSGFDVPVVDDVEMGEISEDKISKINGKFTGNITNHMKQIMDIEDFHVFCVLFIFVTKKVDIDTLMPGFTECLLIRDANEKKIGTYESNLKRPDWLSVKSYNQLINTSNFCPAFQSVIQMMVQQPSAIQYWCEKMQPEKAMLPHSGTSTDMKYLRLLAVKLLRPDRLYYGLLDFAADDVKDMLNTDIGEGVSILQNCPSSRPVMIVGDVSGNDVVGLFHELMKKENAKELIQISVHDSNESAFNKQLNNVIQKEAWLLVENAHLADQTFLDSLYNRLSSLHAHQDAQAWRVFLLAHDVNQMPVHLLFFCNIVAASNLSTSTRVDILSEDLSWVSVLQQNIIISLDDVANDIWLSLSSEPLLVRSLFFSVCIFHGYLMAHVFICSASNDHLVDAKELRYVLAWLQKEANSDTLNNILINDLIELLKEDVYGPKLSAVLPVDLLENLAHEIIARTFSEQRPTIECGSVLVHVPPTNTDPVDYAAWTMKKFAAADEEAAFGDASGMKREQMKQRNAYRSTVFFEKLQSVYEAVLGGNSLNKSADTEVGLDVSCVLEVVDTCIERLPTLLDLPQAILPQFSEESVVARQLRSPVSPQKSVRTGISRLTLASIERPLEPVALGTPSLFTFHILKDCEQFNAALCSARLTLNKLKSLLPRGITSLPAHLFSYSKLLSNKNTPHQWLAKHEQGENISIYDWLKGINQKHSEMRDLLIDTPKRFQRAQDFKPDYVIHLSSFNDPAALIFTLKYSRSKQLACSLDEVHICCRFIDPGNKFPLRSVKANNCDIIAATGLYLQNASLVAHAEYMLDKSVSTLDYEPLPLLIIWADTVLDEQAFKCPVYSNLNERRLLFHLPVPSQLTSQELLFFKPSISISPPVTDS